MEKSRELTKKEKLEALERIKNTYLYLDLYWGLCHLSSCMMDGRSIDHDQHCFFNKLLKAKRRLQGYSFDNHGYRILDETGYYWPKGDKESRLRWLDEQIKLVEMGGFEDTLEAYIKKEVQEGYILKNGKPGKCICGCTDFEQVNQHYGEGCIEAYDLKCANNDCSIIVASWSFGYWQI